MRAGKSRCILLVDDHAAVRYGLALVLTEEGVGECREAAGRGEALSSASSERPDLALVDLAPGTDDVLELVHRPISSLYYYRNCDIFGPCRELLPL
jgi:DNA-binding NarL/FixJ family response regulator